MSEILLQNVMEAILEREIYYFGKQWGIQGKVELAQKKS